MKRWWASLSPRALRAVGRAFGTDLSPAMRWVLLSAALLHGIGIAWGLPASDSWDCDGIAPRDILPGLAATFTPGDYFTYPPAHLALLALLTLPWTVAAVARAGTTRVPAVIHEIIAPGTMTAVTFTARIVALVMSLGIALALGGIAAEIVRASARDGDDERAGRAAVFTAAIASAGVIFTYYAHTSNLDVPSLFWSTLAARCAVRAIARAEPRRLRHVAILAALGVASKDQVYALFAMSLPVLIGIWAATDRARRRAIVRETILATVIGGALLALLDGAVTNPSGFARRVAFLRGPASQDFSNYAADLYGRAAIAVEIARELPRHYPVAFAVFIAGGAVIAWRAARRAGALAMLASAAPLAMVVSFTVAFNFAARRTDDRFILPQMLLAAIYGGIGMERVWSLVCSAHETTSRRSVSLSVGRARLLVRGACVFALGLAVWEALRVDLTLVNEPRYETEAFLRENVRPGDTIEVHGLNVYLPRFPEGAHVTRIGPGPTERRGPLPGVEEVQGRFMDIEQRRPRFVVISTCFAWRYLPVDTSSHDGRIYPTNQAREAADSDATAFFGGMFSGALGYRIVHDAKIRNAWFSPMEIHASLNCRTTTFSAP